MDLAVAVAALDALPNSRRRKFVLAEVRCGLCRQRVAEVVDTVPRAFISWTAERSETWDGPPRKSRKRFMVAVDDLPERDALPAMCKCRAVDIDPGLVRDTIRKGLPKVVIP